MLTTILASGIALGAVYLIIHVLAFRRRRNRIGAKSPLSTEDYLRLIAADSAARQDAALLVRDGLADALGIEACRIHPEDNLRKDYGLTLSTFLDDGYDELMLQHIAQALELRGMRTWRPFGSENSVRELTDSLERELERHCER